MAKLKSGKLYIINFVDIEDYLRSVVPSESYASWPIETLKAQAVAARTYAYYQARHREDWSYDLVDNAGDQAYKGINREHPKTSKAVKATAGKILTYEDKPILAMYSANSGGHTADAGSIFSLAKPYLVAHPDPESLKGKMARWTKTYSVSEVEAGLNRRGIKVKGLERIEPAETGPSGRIVKVRVIARSGSKVLRTRTTLRRALNLPEILLTIQRNDGQFIFDGRGWGHGVGYSQWGSAILGKEKHYDQILRFYYPNAVLEKKW
ncbi:MAG: SpoIID/LytB domain-containing protein [Deltaproteobacteria bacterium]|nr:SpoIID/LytB domain-containing protein [Deltaproteobacteria bacterium]